jgi:hypothetical protein
MSDLYEDDILLWGSSRVGCYAASPAASAPTTGSTGRTSSRKSRPVPDICPFTLDELLAPVKR